MTREEAIKVLENMPIPPMDGYSFNDISDALYIAVEALNQITGKLNNPDDSLLTADSEVCKEQKSKLDLISRAEAIEAITETLDAIDHVPKWVFDKLTSAIDILPSANRPRGYWKDGKWCSVCGMPIATDVWGTSVDESEVHYCIECGAKMDGERSDE